MCKGMSPNIETKVVMNTIRISLRGTFTNFKTNFIMNIVLYVKGMSPNLKQIS